MIRMLVRPMLMREGLIRTVVAGYRPNGKNKIKPYEEKEKQPQPSPKKMKSMTVYEDQS